MRFRIAIAGFASLLLAALPATVFAGYAPANRPTFQCITPTNCPGANYVVFNSFTNAPNYGDERAFFDAKDANITSPGGYQDNTTVYDGEHLELRVYIHNNANPNAIGFDAATAHNTTLQVLLPTSTQTTEEAAAQISASNANPTTVSDTADFNGPRPFSLSFDTSAPVNVTYRPNGQGDYVTRALPSASFSNDWTMNANFGDWHGCFNYAALVTLTAVVHMQSVPQSNFACTELDVAQIDRTRFDFTAHATVQNVTVQSYKFTALNGSNSTVDTNTVDTNALSAVYHFNQSTPGTYTVNAVVNTDHGSTSASACSKQIVVSAPPQVLATSLPNTGPGDVLGIFAGVSSLGAAGHYAVRRFKRY